MLSLDLYDGGSDPVDHLDHFRTHLSLHELEDSVMYRCFPLTLKGDAQIWFHHLPLGTISSFRELTDLFLAQYASSRREEKQPWYLSHIKPSEKQNPLPGPMPQQKRPTRQNVRSERISLCSSLIRGEKFLKWPKPLKKDSKNQSKYCDFHRSAGHSTEDCKMLQREIEDLIRRGHIMKFVRGPG
ncbi:hypothetical protein Nepgr_027422 [Nepenthes gracilis]|uniref:Retrotransposon gag domain-containing protein n=1 Tax=Nepenthes gracilis TaxID=150966 RepID=A0AAD3TAS6_NEPGR|nr:hypothetical protein Nepgr_027422 [Nepenthes gracilis]